MMILPIAALLLALSTSSLAHPSPFPGNSPTPSPSHSTSSAGSVPPQYHEASSADTEFDLFHPKDIKALALASTKEDKDRDPSYHQLISKVHLQLTIGAEHLKKAKNQLSRTHNENFYDDEALNIMKSLRRSAIALPDFIKAMKRIDPETHRHSYQGQIHSLITLFKKNDFTDAKAYAAAKKLKHEMYYDISNPEALLGLIPEAYHMLRINMFLHNFIQGRKTLKEAKTSKVHHPPIRDGQDRLAALNAPILSTSDDLRELQNVEKLQKALEAVESPPKHFRILNDKRQYESAIQSLSVAAIKSQSVAQGALTLIVNVANSFPPELKRNTFDQWGL